MPPGSTEWFVGECSTDKERQFVQAIRARAEHWTALDVSPNQTFTQRASGRLILAVDIDDPERNCILRTLRVDYDDSGIIFGPDETHQFATDLDIARPDVARCCITAAPEYFAGVAADWFEHELRRPIERHEWIN